MDVALNWLWHGGVVAFAAAMILRVVPRPWTQARYGVLWAACAAVLVLPAISLLGTPSTPAGGGPPSSTVPLVAMPFTWWTSATVALGMWAIWAAGYAGRTAAAMLALRDMKRQAREFPAGLEARLPHWTAVRETGRRTRLIVSSQVRTASVLGGGAPVIAVSPALLDHLSSADLDRVVIHEWAHVQRRDDVGQIAQLLARIVAGWHPALWWLERQLHLEREVACDEIAVAITGSAKAYASCLTSLAAVPAAAVRRVPALAAVSSSGVGQRVVRILAGVPAVPTTARRAAAGGAAIAMLVLASFVGRLQVIETVFALPRAPLAAMANHIVAGLTGEPVMPRLNDDAPRPTTPARVRSRHTPSHAAIAQDPDDEVRAIEPVAERLAASPLTRGVTELPALLAAGTSSATPRADDMTASGQDPLPFWNTAAGAGKAIGAGSEQAALATAGAFSRFGKRIAGSF